LSQGLNPASARRRIAAFASIHGERIADPVGELTAVFPTAQAVAGLDPDRLDPRPATASALWHLASELADGTLDVSAGCDWNSVAHQLRALPGLSTDTVSVIALRALGDPDVLVAGDPAVRRGAARAGLPGSASGLAARSAAWQPWRSYAAEYLSATHPAPGRPASGRAARTHRTAGPVEQIQRTRIVRA
jgi:AraC family transcriptional regulator of adaptative response / DNA-3-methyladenine glycosylase II